MKIGTKLKKLREEKGLTIIDVSKLMNKSCKSIYRIESAQDLNSKIIKEYCKAIGVPLSFAFISHLFHKSLKINELKSIREDYRHWDLTECSKNIGVSIEDILLQELLWGSIIDYANKLGVKITIRVNHK